MFVGKQHYSKVARACSVCQVNVTVLSRTHRNYKFNPFAVKNT